MRLVLAALEFMPGPERLRAAREEFEKKIKETPYISHTGGRQAVLIKIGEARDNAMESIHQIPYRLVLLI
jgi:hypothetical protein